MGKRFVVMKCAAQMTMRVCAALWGLVLRPICSEMGFTVSLISLEKGMVYADDGLWDTRT